MTTIMIVPDEETSEKTVSGGVPYKCMSPCDGYLGSSGQEPYRLECQKCGRNYFLVVQLTPCPKRISPSLLGEHRETPTEAARTAPCTDHPEPPYSEEDTDTPIDGGS